MVLPLFILIFKYNQKIKKMKSSLKNINGKWIWECQVEVDMETYEDIAIGLMKESRNYEEEIEEESIIEVINCAYQRAFMEGEEVLEDYLEEEICNW